MVYTAPKLLLPNSQVFEGTSSRSSNTLAAGFSEDDSLPQTDQPVHLLLLEDNEADQKLIEIYLSYAQELYFTHVSAHSLCEARQFLDEYKFDAALLDYYLPDGNGIELVNELSPSIYMPTVILSEHGNDLINHDMLCAGLYDFIPKVKMNPVLLEKVLKLAIMRAHQMKLADEGDSLH